ncbi:DDT domain-containing protein [Cocos nucifera]|uniref:DDT domain-containing protein n=1 Tax=Cocos nucifera TaxID=13894 RepID=A0A8K0IX74_COCNU|nr:DDT domain-containing protein [Cocos nucifera]
MEIDEPERTTDSATARAKSQRIQRLNEAVVNRFAAGEVIQRRASGGQAAGGEQPRRRGHLHLRRRQGWQPQAHPDEYQVAQAKRQRCLTSFSAYTKSRVVCKVSALSTSLSLFDFLNSYLVVQGMDIVLFLDFCDTIGYAGTLSLKDLVNEVYTKLQECLFEGLELHARKEQSVFACRILKILDDGDTTQYRVGWVDKAKKVTDTSIVKADELIQKKPPFSRNVLKAFIRESTSTSAPWIVHENLAKKHGISTELPEELKDKFIVQNGKVHKNAGRNNVMDVRDNKINKKRKERENENLEAMGVIKKKLKREEEKVEEKPVKYPIDDLLVQPAADDPVFSDRPILSTDFRVPMDCVGNLLMIWDFCSSFSRLLHLWPFSLEDFENALCHKDSDLMLIVELHSAIIRLLIKDESDYFMAIQSKKRKSKITLSNWAEYLCDFLEMEGRAELSSHVATIKRGHYGLLDINVKVEILHELVSEALTTYAIREKLDDCIEQQQALAATRREELRKKKEEQHLKKEETDNKEMDQGHILENGKVNSHNSVSQQGTEKVPSSKKNHISENGEIANKLRMDDGGGTERVKNLSGTKDNHKQWGYYSAKEELDALMGSLNPKGERERALQRQLEKYYLRISMALQKRSKDVAQKILLEEAVLRRSTRVRAQPRDSPAMAFLRYKS